MPALTIDESDGYLELTFTQKGAEPIPVNLDMFEAHNAYAVIHAAHADLVERGKAWTEWLATKGAPPLSHGAAFAIAGQLIELVADFAKKKPGLGSESVASADSSTSASPTSCE